MSIALFSVNPNQVTSFQRLDVDILDPTRKLFIFSGIAIPAFEIDDNDAIHRVTVTVDLGLALPDFQQGVAQVGLASIANDDSEFVLSTDNARVDAVAPTGALTLSVDIAVSGDNTALNRFSFQVLVLGGVRATGVSGRVTWDKSIFDASELSPAQIASLFVVNATTSEVIVGPPCGFSTIKTTTIASTIPQSIHTDSNQFWAPYSFDHLPLNTAMQFVVALSSAFPPTVSAGQVNGPASVTLTTSHLSESGVDFLVVQTPVIR